MSRRSDWFRQWGGFLAGVCIGLVIVVPVFASPLDGPPFSGDLDVVRVLGACAFIIALLVFEAVSARRARVAAKTRRRIDSRSDR